MVAVTPSMISLAAGLAASVVWSIPALASFASCVADLKSSALAQGIDRSIVDAAFNVSAPDEKVLRLSKAQPEFKTPIWDYLGFLVDEQRVADGQAMMHKYDRVLRRRGEAVRRQPLRDCRGLGSRVRLRARRRRQFPAARACDARLQRRAAHEFLARRIERGAEARRPRRPRAERALRVVGRRLRPDAVHPLHLSAPRSRLRRRRPPRPRELGRRRARLDRQLSEALRMAEGRVLDDRGAGPRGILRPEGEGRKGEPLHLGRSRPRARRWEAARR